MHSVAARRVKAMDGFYEFRRTHMGSMSYLHITLALNLINSTSSSTAILSHSTPPEMPSFSVEHPEPKDSFSLLFSFEIKDRISYRYCSG